MTTERTVNEDTIVTVTTIEESRYVQFDDILDSVRIEYDDCYTEAPWKDCDGYEHNAEHVRYDGDDDRRGARGYVAGRDSVHITIDDDDVRSWGNYDYYRANGCSKQVAHELVAQVKRNTIDRLVDWYSNGWCYYVVVGEYNGYEDSLGGIDSEDYAEECKVDVAREVAAQMERDGYIVEGRPDRQDQTNLDRWKMRYKHKSESFVIK